MVWWHHQGWGRGCLAYWMASSAAPMSKSFAWRSRVNQPASSVKPMDSMRARDSTRRGSASGGGRRCSAGYIKKRIPPQTEERNGVLPWGRWGYRAASLRPVGARWSLGGPCGVPDWEPCSSVIGWPCGSEDWSWFWGCSSPVEGSTSLELRWVHSSSESLLTWRTYRLTLVSGSDPFCVCDCHIWVQCVELAKAVLWKH